MTFCNQETVTQLPDSAEFGQPCRKLAVGLDVGNGRAKVVINGACILLPAYVLPVSGLQDWEKPSPARDGCYFRIGAGTRDHLNGTEYLVGKPAYEREPESAQKTLIQGKVEHALLMLLGAVAALPYQKETWWLNVVVSLPRVEAETSQRVVEALDGVYGVRGKDGLASTVSVKVLAVVPEGLGAIASAGAKGKSVLLDFGDGTSIATASSGGTVLKREVVNYGVHRLYERIADSDEAIAQFGQKLDTAVIRAGIERGDFLCRVGNTTWNFRSTYDTALSRWVNDTIPLLLKPIQPWMNGDGGRFATGGGALLPELSGTLQGAGFSVIADPVWANAKGLHQMATAFMAKGE